MGRKRSKLIEFERELNSLLISLHEDLTLCEEKDNEKKKKKNKKKNKEKYLDLYTTHISILARESLNLDSE